MGSPAVYGGEDVTETHAVGFDMPLVPVIDLLMMGGAVIGVGSMYLFVATAIDYRHRVDILLRLKAEESRVFGY